MIDLGAANPAKSAILGLILGDALGLPFEATSRTLLARHPVEEMRGYGTYQQPPGTWSRFGALSLCLADSLSHGYQLRVIAEAFIKWKSQSYWSALGESYDLDAGLNDSIGHLESVLSEADPLSLHNLRSRNAAKQSSGSLPHLLPLTFAIEQLGPAEQLHRTWEVSALTHPPLSSALASYLYLQTVRQLIEGLPRSQALANAQSAARQAFAAAEVPKSKTRSLQTLLEISPAYFEPASLRTQSDLSCLKAGLWAWFETNTFEQAVLAAVNLGGQTAKTAGIAGGLAGLTYGQESFPKDWLAQIPRLQDICQSADALWQAYQDDFRSE